MTSGKGARNSEEEIGGLWRKGGKVGGGNFYVFARGAEDERDATAVGRQRELDSPTRMLRGGKLCRVIRP